MTKIMTDISENPIFENSVTVFQLDGQPVRGRAVTMGSALNKALGTRYPDVVARLLGEAMLCLLYTSPSPRDQRGSRMPSSA